MPKRLTPVELANFAEMDPLQVHWVVVEGIPTAMLEHLLKGFMIVERPALLRVLKVSQRTLQRRKNGRLSSEVSEILVDLKSIVDAGQSAFGSREIAERWLSEPALALNNHTPLDLIGTRQGAKLVRDQLIRMEFGIYV